MNKSAQLFNSPYSIMITRLGFFQEKKGDVIVFTKNIKKAKVFPTWRKAIEYYQDNLYHINGFTEFIKVK